MATDPRRTGLFAIPPGQPYAPAFAQGFFDRYATLAPGRIARITVYVNTSLAMQSLEQALADIAPAPGVLPRMVLMSELHGDPLLCPDLPASIDPLRRRLRLTRLVESFLTATRQVGERMAPLSAAPDLADALAELIDQCHDEGLPPGRLDEALSGAGLGADAARHWDHTLRFVDLVRAAWPEIRHDQEGGALDPRARQRSVIDSMIDRWAADPPEDPVIAAGSTGSVGSTARFLAAVAALPTGAVVLPGFDNDIDAETWDAVNADHPFGPFRAVLDQTGTQPGDIAHWTQTSPAPRSALLAQALRPAPVTDHWHAAAPALSANIGAATEALSLIEADTQRHEAIAVAVAIREALEVPDQTVLLITPDAPLARRVSAALSAYGVEPDDTMGRPLAQSPPGVLMRLLVEIASDRGTAVTLAALLQHPLMRPGIDRDRHRTLSRAYEAAVLRGAKPVLSDGSLPGWPKPPEDGAEWLATIEAMLAPLRTALNGGTLGDCVQAHWMAALALTDAGDGPEITGGDAGPAIAAFFDKLAAQADAFGDGLVADYSSLLSGLMRGEQLRPKPRRPHPRVSICGPREARLAHADTVILAGLNDGVWPAAPDPGPWLSRPMREALGLPLPERAVGLSAHDFLNAAAHPRVLFSRSRKIDGAATVSSRWLIRLETLMKGIGATPHWQAMAERGARYLAIAGAASQPRENLPRALRPAPVPPPEARPRGLSVTAIETLVRDAYAIYARHVLRLKPLEPLGRDPDARERGTLVHTVLERFIDATRDWPGEKEAQIRLQQIADQVLAAEVPEATQRRAWRAAIARMAQQFLPLEAERRATGRPDLLEQLGAMMLNLPGGPFEIRAKADRIDRLRDGTAAVYDYKTGQLPTAATIKTGFHHQLHVQAAILAAGGFVDAGPRTASSGAYLGVSGSKSSTLEVHAKDLATETPKHLEHVTELLTAYDTGSPFVSHGRPQKTRYAGDYDHLARVGEWTAEEES